MRKSYEITFECTDCENEITVIWENDEDELSTVFACPECRELFALIDDDSTIKVRNNPTENDLRIFENPQVSECENCGMEYDQFRTGETFQTVIDDLWVGSDDPEDWNYKTRHSVLGKWHQIKQSMWADHLDQCDEIAESGEVYEPTDEIGLDEY